MLKIFEDKYDIGRTPIDTGLLSKILQESIKLTGNTLDDEACHKAVLMFVACTNYYLYLHPQQYIDFGKFVAYRGIDLKNLLTIEAKDGENASTIYEYYKNGGAEALILKQIINTYASELVVDSVNAEERASEDIKKLQGLTSHGEPKYYNNNKENENGN